MNTKHTPGPWTVGRVGTEQGQHFAITSPDGEHIATVGEAINSPNGSGNSEANARLIAAAPELLAALNEIMISPNSPAAKQRAFEAIAKATNTP